MKIFFRIAISIFLLVAITREVLADSSDFKILESSTANVACYSRDPDSSLLSMRDPSSYPFIKNNFIYFTPETKFFYYWAKFNHGSLFSILFLVKIILPNGEVAYIQSLALAMPSSDTDKPIIIDAQIPLRDKIKGNNITPDKYGKWSIEIYLKDELLDKKYFYVDNENKLLEIAEKNNEKVEVAKYYDDLKTYKETEYMILEKDGKVKFIYLGFPKERVLEELGQPFKIETAIESGKTFEKWTYLTDIKIRTKPGGWISRLGTSISDGDAARIVTDKKDCPFAGGVIFHIENGRVVRIRFP